MRGAPISQHILVVEDDKVYERILRRMLESAGFRVSTANDFLTALPIIESSEHLDLLLVDINMPSGTPHGLSIGLMAESKRPDLKIIYMSGSVDPAQVARFAPHAKVLCKPFTMQEVVMAIATTLAAA